MRGTKQTLKMRFRGLFTLVSVYTCIFFLSPRLVLGAFGTGLGQTGRRGYGRSDQVTASEPWADLPKPSRPGGGPERLLAGRLTRFLAGVRWEQGHCHGVVSRFFSPVLFYLDIFVGCSRCSAECCGFLVFLVQLVRVLLGTCASSILFCFLATVAAVEVQTRRRKSVRQAYLLHR